MASIFYGLEIARTALHYNQKALEVTSHNVANAETEGYTRQRIHSSSIDPYKSGSLVAALTNTTVGGGVNIDSMEQIRNQFLDKQYRSEASLIGEWSVKSDALEYIEQLFAEPSDAGIMNSLNNFFKGMQELSSNVGSKDTRTNFIQQAITLTDTVRHYKSQLTKLKEQQDFALNTSVNQFNEILNNIADINESIANYELGGNCANDLRDKRNVLLDSASEYANINYFEFGKEFNLSIEVTNSSGSKEWITVIEHNKAIPVSIVNVSSFTSGKLKGYMDMRDGNTDEVKGVQYFMNKLDSITVSFVNQINSIHKSGWTYPGTIDKSSRNGVNLFDSECTNADTFYVADEVLNDVFNIAASSGEIKGYNNTGNNENLLRLISLRDKQPDNIETEMTGFLSEMGIAAANANIMLKNGNALLDNIDIQRMSISGVSIDEEMANMVKFEKSYQASARLITAIDEMLDVLINKTGIVGR